MIAQHTLTHAIQYLREAQVTLLARGWEHATSSNLLPAPGDSHD